MNRYKFQGDGKKVLAIIFILKLTTFLVHGEDDLKLCPDKLGSIYSVHNLSTPSFELEHHENWPKEGTYDNTFFQFRFKWRDDFYLFLLREIK